MVQTNEMMSKIGINKTFLKEQQVAGSRVVYMDDDQEFQIYLRNPHQYTVGVQITINNIPQKSMLVLRPGEHVWLERFLDGTNKFLFSTYEVKNDKISRIATKNNGTITLKYYKEWEGISISPSVIYSSTGAWYYPDGYFTTSTSNIGSHTNSYNTYYSNPNPGTESGTLNASSITIGNSTSSSYTTANSCKNIETGRIEKGDYSEQQFEEVDSTFEFNSFREETIKILPISQKPVTTKDLMKRYCTQCGRKLNPKYKFCPQCGAKVE